MNQKEQKTQRAFFATNGSFFKRSRREKGYTAVELILAMGIIGTVIFSSQKIYQVITRSYAQVFEKSRLERDMVFTMQQVVQEVRQARSVDTLGNTKGTAVTLTNIHLDAAGVTVFSVKVPNITDPVNANCDSTLTFFLRTMPDGTVKLFQRLRYYTGAYTEAFPAMAETDQYRKGTGVTVTPVTEPTPIQVGVSTPTPVSTGSTPTPSFNTKLGRMPSEYVSNALNFDDVCIYYDSANNFVAVGLTLSLKSASLTTGNSFASRRRLQLSSTVALRAQ